MEILFVIDPPLSLKEHKDSSIAMMRAAQARGHGISICQLHELHLWGLYNRAQISSAQQLSYDVYGWYLDDQIRSHTFTYSDYPLSPVLVSYHTNLTQFFTDIHPVRNLADAQDYVARLAQVKRQADQVINGMKYRQDAGVILPKFYFPVVLRRVA